MKAAYFLIKNLIFNLSTSFNDAETLSRNVSINFSGTYRNASILRFFSTYLFLFTSPINKTFKRINFYKSIFLND
ncbi:hypothetical protein APR41_05500 [Salegentibacter salinarum]|uniref:Uncharacterized protein n=1 Tax=Salegentibacter salinarum TaxID=447422 RepID=A0A2N0TSE0_9FLAO|nr:hypothetical protein APR41_05500 [Salegentibacter salinarum]